LNSLLLAIIAACNAYSLSVSYAREHEIDQLEDEIDQLAGIGDGSSKLRIERLSQRLKRKRSL
jgi:hypothetical protein